MSIAYKCINPAQVNEEDYLAHLEADGRPEFEQHLTRCGYCQQELEAYRTLDRRMHQEFAFITGPSRTLCATSQQLGDFVLRRLSSMETGKVHQHLEYCPYCTQEVESIRNWLLSLGAGSTSDFDRLADPPGTSTAQTIEWLRRVVAVMLSVGPSETTTPHYVRAGVRGSDEGLPQTYQAEEVFITLTVQPIKPRSNHLLVMGLVQRDNYPLEATSGLEVRLTSGETLLATETIDELGNFVFEDVTSPTSFDLEITLEDKIVMVKNLSQN